MAQRVMYSVGLCNQQDTAKIMMCDFQGWDIKDTGFHLVLLLGSPGSGEATMQDIQVALWRYTHVVKGLRSPAYGQHRFTIHMNKLPWKYITQPQKAFRCLQPTLTFWIQPYERPWSRIIQLGCLWIPDPCKLCEIINVYSCFKPLNFRVSWYVAIDDHHIHTCQRT